MYRIFIDGHEGTTGLRIHERLRAFSDLEVLVLEEGVRKDPQMRRQMLHEADIAFLCLPDAAAKESVALAQGSKVRMIDASTAHRTSDAFAYGFAELVPGNRARIEKADRVAVPGCHASGYLALVYPLIHGGLLEKTALLSCTSLTGYSGGGKSMIAEYQNDGRDEAYGSPRQYALTQTHKHLAEIVHNTGMENAPVFMPVVGDFYAGMLVSVPLHGAMLQKKSSAKAISELYANYYGGNPLIQVHPFTGENGFLAANALAGKDTMEIFVEGNDARMTLIARYDNLGKGASGAAVQCMNLMLGHAETMGLAL